MITLCNKGGAILIINSGAVHKNDNYDADAVNKKCDNFREKLYKDKNHD